MAEEVIILECRKIWATDVEIRNDVDKFLKFYDALEDAFDDLDMAFKAFDEGRFETNKFIKEFYDEALRYLDEMKKLAEKIKNKRLIEVVKTKKRVFGEYKIYMEHKGYLK